MTASEVNAFFADVFGGPRESTEAYDRMIKFSLDDLENYQGLADEVSAGGSDEAARKAGLDWSTLMSTVIA